MKKRNKYLLVNILLFFFTVFIFLLIFEVAVRMLNVSSGYDYPEGMYREDPVLGYSLSPNFSGKFIKQEFETEVTTNSYGIRDAEFSEKTDSEFRILALGDSFVWGGYGTRLEETYLKILQEKLNINSNGPEYLVINAGVPGYGTDQELLYLIDRGFKLKPDLVLLNFFVGNDFLNNLEENELTVVDGVTVTNKPREKLSEKFRSFLLLNFHSYRITEKGLINLFGDFIAKHVRGKLQQDDYQSQLFLETATNDIDMQFENTRKILDSMNSFLSERNVGFAIVLIPLKFQVDDNLRQDFIRNNYKPRQEFDMEKPQKFIKEWGSENDVFVIDLLPELRKLNVDNDYYWRLNPHFNIKGNEIVGTIIFDELTKNYLIE